jgi:hypothetical protein
MLYPDIILRSMLFYGHLFEILRVDKLVSKVTTFFMYVSFPAQDRCYVPLFMILPELFWNLYTGCLRSALGS